MLSEALKMKCRHHMGYLAVQAAQTFVLGVPAGVQTQFMIEGAFNKILPGAERYVLEYIEKLDKIECQIDEDTENVAVESIGDIVLRKDEFKQLIIRYQHWQGALANLFGVTPNPFDQRPWLGSGYNGGASGINVSVSH